LHGRKFADTGGSAPMVFSWSMIIFKSPARPSPSMVMGKPSSLAVNVNFACGSTTFS